MAAETEAAAELIRAIIDDSSMAAAALQSLTSLKSSVETSLSSPPTALVMEASEAAGTLQNLCHRMRQRAADAQRSQLAVARASERETATAKKLEYAERSAAQLRTDHERLAQNLRELEARHGRMAEKNVSVRENERLEAALRDREAALIGERELVTQLNAALHRAANENERDRHASSHAAAAAAAAEAALSHAAVGDAAGAKAAAVTAMMANRELAIETDVLRRELGVTDADLCLARVGATGDAAALAGAQAVVAAERTSRARLQEELAASRRSEERLTARVAAAEEEATRAAKRQRDQESEMRRAAEAARGAKEAAVTELARVSESARLTASKLEASEREAAGAKAELVAERDARVRLMAQTSAELAAYHEEHAAGSAAAAADRANLLGQLERAHAKRAETDAALSALQAQASTATSLEAVVPALSTLIAKLESTQEEVHARAFADANARTKAAVAAAEAPGGEAAALESMGIAGGVAAPAGKFSELAAHADVDEAISRAAEWERTVSSLREEVESLELELASRPSVKAVKQLSARVSELEQELAEALRKKREPLWSVQYVPRHVSPTRDAIKRDKEIAKLGGIDIDSMAPADVHAMLLDVCRLLGLRSVHTIVDRIKQLSAVAASTPALETFMKSTRAIVTSGAAKAAKPGSATPPAAADENESGGGALGPPRKILEELKRWAAERTELAELRAFKDALNTQLGKYHAARASAPDQEEGGEEAGIAAPAPEPSQSGQASSGRGGGGRGSGRGRGRAKVRTPAMSEAAESLVLLVSEAIGEDYAEAAARLGGLSPGGVCAALREMVGASTAEDSLRRVRILTTLERDLEARTVELALLLELKADATLTQCLAKLRALEAAKGEVRELIDTKSANELLRRLRAHDGPSALTSLEAIESKGKSYRQAFGRFQQQMSDFGSTGGGSDPASRRVGAASETVWRGTPGGTVKPAVQKTGADRAAAAAAAARIAASVAAGTLRGGQGASTPKGTPHATPAVSRPSPRAMAPTAGPRSTPATPPAAASAGQRINFAGRK